MQRFVRFTELSLYTVDEEGRLPSPPISSPDNTKPPELDPPPEPDSESRLGAEERQEDRLCVINALDPDSSAVTAEVSYHQQQII